MIRGSKALLAAENAALRAEIEKLRGAAAYQAEAYMLRRGTRMLTDVLRSWGFSNRSQESNGAMIRRALDTLYGDARLMAHALAGLTPDGNTQDGAQYTATQAAIDAAVARYLRGNPGASV